MRICAIIPGLPEPADRGTYKRYRAWVNALAEMGDVDLVCLRDRDDSEAALAIMADRVHRLCAPRVTFQPWRGLIAQWRDHLPPNVRHWFDPAAAATVAAFTAGISYDLVFLGDLVSIPYADVAGLPNNKRWLDRARVDIEFQTQRDAAATNRSWRRKLTDRLRRRMTARFERYAANNVAGEVVCAESDRVALQRCVGTPCEQLVIANGIERDEFPDQGPLTNAPTFMLPGAMDYRPNVEGALWFLDKVWPRIRAARPDAKLALVGRDPVTEIRAWQGRDGVAVTGAVDSMLPWYQRSRVVVAPIRIGCGTRLKVVEAWSVGRPLVATAMAVDGLDARHGDNTLIADDPFGMAEACLAALDQPMAQRLRGGALAIAQSYAWADVLAPAIAHWGGRIKDLNHAAA